MCVVSRNFNKSMDYQIVVKNYPRQDEKSDFSFSFFIDLNIYVFYVIERQYSDIRLSWYNGEIRYIERLS